MEDEKLWAKPFQNTFLIFLLLFLIYTFKYLEEFEPRRRCTRRRYGERRRRADAPPSSHGGRLSCFHTLHVVVRPKSSTEAGRVEEEALVEGVRRRRLRSGRTARDSAEEMAGVRTR